MICPDCDSKISEDHKVCPSCKIQLWSPQVLKTWCVREKTYVKTRI